MQQRSLAPELPIPVELDSGSRPTAALVRLCQLFRWTEEMTESSAGVLKLRSAVTEGCIMAEQGRICWASCIDYSPRLIDRLEGAGLERARLDEVLQGARVGALPFGEALVDLGLIGREEFRHVLLCHTADVLGTLVSEDTDCELRLDSFLAHSGGSYSPSFTFTATELIEATLCVSTELRVAAGPLPPSYSSLVASAAESVCFLELGEDCDPPAVPVSCSMRNGLRLEEALLLYRRGRWSVAPPTLVAAEVDPYAVFFHSNDEGWLASRIGRHLFVLHVVDQAQSVRVLSCLLSMYKKQCESDGDS